MRYEARIQAYDSFEQVLISVRVWETKEPLQRRDEAYLSFTATTRGLGESDPTKWLRGVLEGLLLQTAEHPETRGISGRSVGCPHTISDVGDTGNK